MNTILVIADPNFEKSVAIKQADKLSQLYNAKLHVVYFYYEDLRGLGDKGDAFKESLIARMDDKANDQLAELCENNLNTYEIVWQKHIHTWVNHYAENEKPLMVVKTGNRSETMFYTPTDWHLIRECPAPVLIVAEDKWSRTPDILASVDLQTQLPDKQALNHKILETSTKLASKLNVQVHVCYTPLFSPVLRDFGLQFKDEVEAKAKQDLSATILQLSKQYQVPVDNFHIHAGKPELVIPSMAAKYHAGIVVIGTVGRKGISQKLLGNTAENILSFLKTDVLALKP
ncbi:universal stress protein [Thalassotalea nanhaiensis]|uniref:Universal stress protein n=1 Tax=Thalassotalea nanhaiensis TaxID=3065648 RepID=A0ABY9TF83_9GAMM|nr:universal stress protein [Colwelliaceae bacterium SQ345]